MTAISGCSGDVPPGRVDHWFRRLQLVSAAGFSLMHGANDAQKTMGIIAGALVDRRLSRSGRRQAADSVLGDHGGARRDRPRHAVGRLAHHPHDGVARSPSCSRSAASPRRPARRVAIFTATQLGVGISTTHTITGAIVGVGATRRLSAVRWGVAGQIVWAWILTIPASAAIRPWLLYLVLTCADRQESADLSITRQSAGSSR